jgi:uncharacterized protein YjbJ (UPF0337 family)
MNMKTSNNEVKRALSSTVDAISDANQTMDNKLDELAGKWKQKVGSAKVLWGKLTDDELLKTEGHVQKLGGLLQERYAITKEAADKQVSDFMSEFKK